MVEDSVTTGLPNLIGTHSDTNADAHTQVVYQLVEGLAETFELFSSRDSTRSRQWLRT